MSIQVSQVDKPRSLTSPARAGVKDKGEEIEQLRQRLQVSRERMVTAAIAFCEGSISAGQLRAVRELLREQEEQLARLEETHVPALQEDPPPPKPIVPAVAEPQPGVSLDRLPVDAVPPELRDMLTSLEQKLIRLEEDFHQGRVNASQYRAIRRHYLEQRQVAIRLLQANPKSDRWQVVLQEGKTTFLLQLNEAVCRGVAFFDLRTRERIFLHGEIPPTSEEVAPMLETFSRPRQSLTQDRMFSTHADDGSALLLIPGRFTAALVAFSQDPPAWQVRAIREIHRNFEAANKVALERSQYRLLVFPDLTHFFRP
jgi:hypothetical protein